MIGDAFSYLKEYNEIAAKNRKDKDFTTSDEFLSNMKKTDRLHPVISLCVYYGENPWDGPLCLMDMLEIPDKIRTLVSDYKMNLIELRTSGALKFHDSDVIQCLILAVLFMSVIMLKSIQYIKNMRFHRNWAL